MSFSLIALIFVFPAAMAFAAASDLVSMTISNWICLVLIGTFGACAVLLGLSWNEIGLHLAAGALVLSVSFGFFAAGWIGGGDAKLAAATALWFGFDQLLPYLVLSSVGGGLLTTLILQMRASPLPAVVSGWPWLRRLHAANEGVPYGIALAFAALFILPETGIWRAAIFA